MLVDSDNHVLATGYNGVPANIPHCSVDGGCPGARAKSGTRLGECLAVHAEQNALLRLRGGSPHKAYCTTFPCIHCAKMLAAAGVKVIVYLEDYGGADANLTGELLDSLDVATRWAYELSGEI